MDTCPYFVRSKLSALDTLGLPLDFETESPSLCLILEAHFLDTVDLSVLDGEPLDVSNDCFSFAAAIVITNLAKGVRHFENVLIAL